MIHTFLKNNSNETIYLIRLEDNYHIFPGYVIRRIFLGFDLNKIFSKVKDYDNCYLLTNRKFFDQHIDYLDKNKKYL